MDMTDADPIEPIDEAMIVSLVHAFYGRVRRDAVLGPVFAGVIGADWAPHLAKMCDFWSSVMLRTARYGGRPMQAHAGVPALQPEHFALWLELFRATAREVCPPRAAGRFIARAEKIAESLRLGIMFQRGILPDIPARRAG
ncbi:MULTISPECIES: group III truncated hemoglobin [Inquilinus]|uniref:Hemoglobin n=1 Tax=Inquilinus ginsengisoli TaxID=363840 RepID=A0ABU1JPR0_9PROT|nr:group III truncated hemoglobin [Inquilinus ginsengisoli]MDR6290606.1 hemoglobin [Inquilinus ginsengisoli]